MSVTVGELRAQSAYMDGSAPVVVISSDKRLQGMKLRVVQFFPDTRHPHTGEWKSCFKVKIEVDDLPPPPGEAP